MLSNVPIEANGGEDLVRKAGLEPASLFRRQLLRLVCLPFHHFRTGVAARIDRSGHLKSKVN